MLFCARVATPEQILALSSAALTRDPRRGREVWGEGGCIPFTRSVLLTEFLAVLILLAWWSGRLGGWARFGRFLLRLGLRLRRRWRWSGSDRFDEIHS